MEDPDLETVGLVLEGTRLYFIGGVLLAASAASPVLIKACLQCRSHCLYFQANSSISSFLECLCRGLTVHTVVRACVKGIVFVELCNPHCALHSARIGCCCEVTYPV